MRYSKQWRKRERADSPPTQTQPRMRTNVYGVVLCVKKSPRAFGARGIRRLRALIGRTRSRLRDPSALNRLRRMYTLSVYIFLASYEVSNLYYF